MVKKITKIVAQKRKGRYNVYLNNRYAFPMDENVMIEYRVFKGMEVDENLEQKLIYADNFSKLYNYAVNYLSYHLRTVKEINDHLKQKNDDEDIIEKVIQKLQDLKLVDDKNYASSLVRSQVRERNKGPLSIKNSLKLKGVSDEFIQYALDNYYPHSEVINNGFHQANKLFNHHGHDAFNRQVQKVKQSLVRKGYSFSDVQEIMDQVEVTPDPDKQRRLLNQKGERLWQKYSSFAMAKRKLKTKQGLYRKGFNLDDIDNLLSQLQ